MLFSAITLAWMSTDRDRLEILTNGGTPQQQRYAEIVLPVRTGQANLLLCSLLIANVAVNAGLVSVLSEATSVPVGFGIASALILIFGELIPQLYVSRIALAVSANTVWLVKLLIVITGIISWPLSKIVDFVAGEEVAHYMTRDELREMLTLHGKNVEGHAAKIMSGALDLSGKTVKDVMTPISDVYRLEINKALDFNVLLDVFNSGYSRIPCYDSKLKSDPTRGLLFVKDLILIDPKDAIPLNTLLKLYGRPAVHVFPDIPLSKMLEMFKSGKSHLAIVHDVNNEGDGDPFYEELGVITLEDIIEEILQDNIVDETDVYVDIHEKQKVLNRKVPDVSALHGGLRRKLPGSYLSPQELSAVYFHLRGNVDAFKPGVSELTPRAIRKMLQSCEVVQVIMNEQKLPGGKGYSELSLSRKPHQHQGFVDIKRGGHYLYVNGKTTEFMTVVLEGRVRITAGRDGFVSEAGKWAVFCPHAFMGISWDTKAKAVREPSAFRPDFSARAVSNVRVLRVTRSQYMEAMKMSKAEDEVQKNRSGEDEKGAGEIGDDDRKSISNMLTAGSIIGDRNSIDTNSPSPRDLERAAGVDQGHLESKDTNPKRTI